MFRCEITPLKLHHGLGSKGSLLKNTFIKSCETFQTLQFTFYNPGSLWSHVNTLSDSTIHPYQ